MGGAWHMWQDPRCVPALSVSLGLAPKTTDGHKDEAILELGLCLSGKEN